MKYIWMVMLVTSFGGQVLFAQAPAVTNNQSLWLTSFTKVYFTKKFFFDNELHVRRAHWGAVPQQFLFRPSLNYEWNDMIITSLGYSFYQNDPYGEFPQPIQTQEHHIWEQLQLKHSLGRFTFRHRYRLEERFVPNVVKDSTNAYHVDGTTFKLRFRYRFMTNFQIKNFEKSNMKLYAIAYDEVFIGLDLGDLINQNRFFVGMGFAFNKYGDIQIGYMNQILKKNANLYESNHNLQIIFSYNIYIKTKSKTNEQ